MPSDKNIVKVKELKEKLSKAKAVVLSDYRGLTVAQMQALQAETSQHQAEYSVAKNRLLKIALREEKYLDGQELDQALTGPTAALFCFADEVAPIKAIDNFSKQNKSADGNTSLPIFKVGFLGKDFLSAERVQNLAQLPGKLELQAKLVGTLNAPVYGLVSVLGGNLRQLVYVLTAIKDNKK